MIFVHKTPRSLKETTKSSFVVVLALAVATSIYGLKDRNKCWLMLFGDGTRTNVCV